MSDNFVFNAHEIYITKFQQEFPFPTIDQQYAATDNQYAATDNQYGATDNDGIAPG